MYAVYVHWFTFEMQNFRIELETNNNNNNPSEARSKFSEIHNQKQVQ